MEQDELRLTWQEHGGPLLDASAVNEGFGSFLARRLVTGQFDGTIAYDWNPQGLIVRLSLPVARLAR